MNDKKNVYIKTKAAYEKLGKRYLEYTKNRLPSTFFDFTKLIKPKGKVLDAGCAGGYHCEKFLENKFKVVGIDFSDYFIKTAKKNVPKASFFKKDLLKINFPSKSFDGIWANASLLHLRKNDLNKVLLSFKKILKNEGLIYISLRRGKGEGFDFDKSEIREKGYYAYYLESEIKSYLKNAGFKTVYIKVFPDKTRKNIKWIRVIAKKI